MKTLITLLLMLAFNAMIMAQSVPNWTKTESQGIDTYTLHDVLAAGNAVILDFMATWCPPCVTSTPALESIWQDYGMGTKKLYIFGMDVDNTETNAQINAFKATYGATYPSFQKCSSDYGYYDANYSPNPGYIPLFVLLIPNITDPGASTSYWTNVGWSAPVETALRNALLSAGFDTTSVASGITDMDGIAQISVYPNPVTDRATVSINQVTTSDIEVELFNSIGQKVSTLYDGQIVGGTTENLDIDVAWLSPGIYYLKVKAEQTSKVIKLNVLQ